MYEPNFKRLDELTQEGYLRKVISPCKRLMLYNYTDKCTYEKKWNKHTLNSRGTVYEIATGKVVARAFPKFFNFSELQPVKQKTILKSKTFETFEKMDGSLGIVYFYDGEWRVNTRGSFTSDQAIKGKELLDKKYDTAQLDTTGTYLVEIIYPENKIIVDYGAEEKLSLLSAIGTKGSKFHSIFTDYDAEKAGFHLGEKYKFESIEKLQEHLATLDHTEEGYVVRLQDGSIVKFKSRAYLDVARIIQNISPLSFWKTMNNGKVQSEYLEHLPEEFREEADNLVYDIEFKYDEKLRNYYKDFKELGVTKEDSRKEIALSSREKDLTLPAMFAILDNKVDVLDKIIMKEIRPFGNVIR